MDKIFAFEGNAGVFANANEVFAIVFNKNEKKAQNAIEKTRKTGLENKDYAGPWNFYRAYMGYDMIEHKLESKHYVLQDVSDWTCDMDYPEVFQNFYKNVIRARKIDDLVIKSEVF